jgi:hypothetical protein
MAITTSSVGFRDVIASYLSQPFYIVAEVRGESQAIKHLSFSMVGGGCIEGSLCVIANLSPDLLITPHTRLVVIVL